MPITYLLIHRKIKEITLHDFRQNAKTMKTSSLVGLF